MKKTLQKIKFIILAIVLGLTINYVGAWIGPTASAPGGNKEVVINATLSDQAKAGAIVPGSLLEVNGRTTADDIAVWNNAYVDRDFYIDSLTGPSRVCVDSQHKLILCGTGSTCGNGTIEPPEECDDGNSNNGDACTNACELGVVGGGGGGQGWASVYACFTENTQVTMADGSKKDIEDIQIGDILKGATSNNTVLSYHRPERLDGKLYGFNGGRLFFTEEHPFMSLGGWKAINPDKAVKEHHLDIPVTKLKIGDVLITETGFMLVKSIENKDAPSDTPLYNFVLSGDRTYYADGYLVHNKVPCDPGVTCADTTNSPHLLTMPGDPEGDILPNGCSSIGAVYQYSATPVWMGGCGGSYSYRGCYSGGVNGSTGIVACGNVAP